MEHFLMEAVNNIINTMSSIGILLGFVLIILESIVPVLPLGVFISLNVIAFGEKIGFIISWLATIIGCFIMFFICKKLQKNLTKKYKNNKKIMKFKSKINNISYSKLVIILAIPFTPAFLINIGAGLSDFDTKKYLYALILGKIPMIYFWSFIGASLYESFTDIAVISKILLMLVLSFLVSKLLNKFLKL